MAHLIEENGLLRRQLRGRQPSPRVFALVEPSVNDLFVEQFVQMFEVRDVQGAHSLDGHTERFIGTTRPALLS